MRRTILVCALGLSVCACNTNLPINPGSVLPALTELRDQTLNTVLDVVSDPLGTDPYPVLLGGNSARIFYATNLLDIHIGFGGAANDLVFPGPIGPTNIYGYSISERQRAVLRPFAPSVASSVPFINAIDTDGEYVAFIESQQILGENPRYLVRAGLLLEESNILLDSKDETTSFVETPPIVDEGRVAFAVYDEASNVSHLIVEDLQGDSPRLELPAPGFGRIMLHGTQLVYVQLDSENNASIHLRDLQTNEDTVVAEGVHESLFFEIAVFATGNTVIWSEPSSQDLQRVLAYDIASGETREWTRGVEGILTGANDTQFLTERFQYKQNNLEKIVIELHTVDGATKQLAKFDANGQAGQSMILGENAVWVNPRRQIVIAPLAGGSRTQFAPY